MTGHPPKPTPATPSAPKPEPTLTLCNMKVGQVGVILEKRLEEDQRAMLRAMGLSCSATVKLCRVGEPCIVAVMTGGQDGGRLGPASCRIGLARPLAEKIVVKIRGETPKQV